MISSLKRQLSGMEKLTHFGIIGSDFSRYTDICKGENSVAAAAHSWKDHDQRTYVERLCLSDPISTPVVLLAKHSAD